MAIKHKDKSQRHIIIDARIRQASTGRPVDRLLEYLQKLDIENKYTVLLKPGDEWKPKSRNFKVVVCKYKMFSLNPLQQLAFSEWLYRLKPDLVHFTMTGAQPLFYFGKQITFTHDLTMFRFAHKGNLPLIVHRLRMQGYKLLMWSAHKKAAVTHTPTQYVLDAVNKKYLNTNRKSLVTYEAAEKPTKDIKKPDIENLDEYILYVGSFFPHKNIRELVRSFGRLKTEHKDLKLVLAGKIEKYGKRMQRFVKKQGLEDDVVFTGFVSEAELNWLYKNALVYVFPSLSEGFGLPGLEAMQHGCPVVSSNATCLPEVYGNGADYFDPEDQDEMVRTINRVIKNKKKRKSLVDAGKKQVGKYSWETMSQQILDIYKHVLSDKKSS